MSRFNETLFGKKAFIAQQKPRLTPRGPRVPHVVIAGVEKKSCARCAHLKPLDGFYIDRHTADGLTGYCRECVLTCRAERALRKKGKP